LKDYPPGTQPGASGQKQVLIMIMEKLTGGELFSEVVDNGPPLCRMHACMHACSFTPSCCHSKGAQRACYMLGGWWQWTDVLPRDSSSACRRRVAGTTRT
jgi:hypothetical protein